tara:strand:+ start:296 stop:943 length:648 start_codon:yes stop_codon:yes gene_type:complete
MYNYLKHISLKLKNIKLANNMKTIKYADETETKEEKKDSENEDKEEAQDLSNPEEKRYDDEMKKSRKAEDKEEKDDDDDNVDIKVSDEDINKLDLTDKQEEYLKDKKDSALAQQVKVLKAQIRSLQSSIRKARLEPIIESIIEAKGKLGKVDAEVEYRSLSKLDLATLHSLKADYDRIADANSQPRFTARYSNASVDGGNRKYGDQVLRTLGGDF